MPSDFKKQVVELLKSLETGDRSPLATINPNKYIQHNLRVADGLGGFRERLESLPKGAAKVNTVRAFQDGNFVFTHSTVPQLKCLDMSTLFDRGPHSTRNPCRALGRHSG